METTTRLITPQDAHFCPCGNLATHSVTDAVQVGYGWTESAHRYGCATHPVVSMIVFESGTTMTMATYGEANANN
jgi:hypothetical protein